MVCPVASCDTQKHYLPSPGRRSPCAFDYPLLLKLPCPPPGRLFPLGCKWFEWSALAYGCLCLSCHLSQVADSRRRRRRRRSLDLVLGLEQAHCRTSIRKGRVERIRNSKKQEKHSKEETVPKNEQKEIHVLQNHKSSLSRGIHGVLLNRLIV